MVEKQTEIDGICELKIIDRNSILIKREKFELLSLYKDDETSLSETTICIGESFNLADADHISNTYKLIRMREGSAILEAELTFTGFGIPKEEWTKKKVISVSPYKSPQYTGNIMKEVTKEEFKAIFIKYGKSQLPPKGEGYWNQVYETRLKENMRYIVRLPESPEEDQMMIVEGGNEISLFFMTDDRVEAFFDFPGKDEL